MPDPDRLLNTLRQAIQAFRADPKRRGHVVHLDDAVDVLVAGDMHGNVENFRQVLLQADLGKHPRRHLVLQELIHGTGRYPTGGDKSHRMLDLLAALKCQYPQQVHMLLGNHELSQWTGQWISKDDEDQNQLFLQGVQTAYGVRSQEFYAAYVELFTALLLAVRTPNRVFLSHSLPSARRLEQFNVAALEEEFYDGADLGAGGAIHALVWGRDTRPDNVQAFLRKVDADLLITGHIPSDKGFDVPNDRQLILDTLGSPACYCLFPADRPLTHAELVECVRTL